MPAVRFCCTAGELESESSITSVAGERLREVQAAAKQQQALASGLITAGELAYICRPLAYVIALRLWVPLSCVLQTTQRLCTCVPVLCHCLSVCLCLALLLLNALLTQGMTKTDKHSTAPPTAGDPRCTVTSVSHDGPVQTCMT